MIQNIYIVNIEEENILIAKFSVKKPYTILVGVVLVLVLGYVSLTRMTTDLFPDMSLPYAIVYTIDMGASPEEVETKISAPIEASMATTSNIKNISSTSSNGVSMVVLEYEQSSNMDSVLIEIQQKLEQLKGGWDDSVQSPIIMQLDPEMMPIMIASADVEGMDQVEITDYVNNQVIPALESVEGIANVTSNGSQEQQLQVTMNQKKIDALNKKIKKKISEQFKEAQDKIDSSTSEITNGQSKLENGKDQLASQIGSSTNEIINNKIELNKQAEQLASQLATLQESKKSVSEAISSLQKAYDGAVKLKEGIDGLTKMQANVEAVRQGAMKSLLLQNPKATKEQQKQAGDLAVAKFLESAKKKTGYDISSEEVLAGMIETMRGQLEGVNTALAAQQESFLASGVNVKTYKDIPKAVGKLSKSLTEINTGITKLTEAQKKVEEGKISLDKALETINQTQIKSVLEMSSTSSQLANASNKLTEGQAQLDSSKDTAIESSDLNTILTVDMLNNILTAQNFSMPAGYAGSKDEQYLVRVGDEVTSQKELENLALMDMGIKGIGVIRLSDVADIELKDKEGDSYCKVNGNPAVMLVMEKQAGYSTGDVTKRAIKKFDSLEKVDEKLSINVLMNQGIYIDIIVQSVLENMIVGAILAILILLLFLKDIRPTLVIACAIPLSVVFAIVLMYFTKISLNIISLSGLALGIGMLVDNSIVVIENIYRLRNEGLSVRKAAVEGASQVAGAIIASTLTTVCVFAPIVFTDGITRQLFVDIALTIAYTLGASLLIALTFVPMMAAGLLKNTKEVRNNTVERIKGGYAKVLQLSLRFKPVVFILVIVLLVISFRAAMSRGMSFMDTDMNADQVSVTIGSKEDQELSFEELTDYADEVAKRLEGVKGIDAIGAMVGGSSGFADMGGTSGDSVSMYITLKEDTKVTSQEISKQIEELTKDMDCEVSTDSGAAGVSAFMGSGISIRVKGSDLEKLQGLAKEVAKVVRNTEGTIKVDDGLEDTTPSFTVVVDKEKAAKYKMTVAQVFQLVYGEMASSKVSTTVSTDLKDYEVYVQSEEQSDVTIDDIRKLKFDYTDKEGKKKKIALSKIADFEESVSLNKISRNAQTRYISVSAQIDEKHNVTLVSDEIKKELKNIKVPEGYSIDMAGEDENIKEAMSQLVLMLILAVVFIYLVMVAQFQSLLSPFIIMFTIPLAFTGGLFALFFTGNEISVVGMIGFVMLAGIIVNNGIVMVDYINQLRREGIDKKEAIIEAGKTRLQPILMTALTTILAMSTMAIGVGSGSEMMQPMAIVTIGGLIYGTVLTLIVVPCIYDVFNRNRSMVEEQL